MTGRKWYEWMLTVVFVAMVALCVYLNLMPGHKESLASIIVNAVMFIIVAIVFMSADFGKFAKMNSIITDLDYATEKIKKDAMDGHDYLWEPYQSSNVELFTDSTLTGLFRDYVFELNREANAKEVYYRPSIDDFINEDLVDDVMHRNEMNQIPGFLTGLGILGTFVGLSMGLQSFNTGTTSEMIDSIEPLMNGIKVAFHTSIYGMVFSLTFNAIYKKKLYEAERSVNDFVNAFKKYVLPDSRINGMNQLIAIQKQQLESFDNLYTNMADELERIIRPEFDNLNRTVLDFETVTARNESEAVKIIVDNFVVQMNESLGSSFTRLAQAIDAQYRAQQDNAVMMQEVLKSVGASTTNMNDINRETSRLIDTLNHYTASIQTIQNRLQDTLSSMRDWNAQNSDYARNMANAIEDMNEQIELLKQENAEKTRF